MDERRNLSWKLNWYRQSELEGALILGRLVRQAREPYLVHRLIEHCADEARHASLWNRTIVRLGMPTMHIRRSYQSFYLDEIRAPRSLTEVLALTHIFEQRVHRQFSEDMSEPGLPAEACRTFMTLVRDEERHLEWIARWLERIPDCDALLRQYREADQRVYDRLRAYRDRIWLIVGPDDEGSRLDEDGQAEELHTA